MLDWSFALARFTVTITVSSLKSHFYDVCLSPAEANGIMHSRCGSPTHPFGHATFCSFCIVNYLTVHGLLVEEVFIQFSYSLER